MKQVWLWAAAAVILIGCGGGGGGGGGDTTAFTTTGTTGGTSTTGTSTTGSTTTSGTTTTGSTSTTGTTTGGGTGGGTFRGLGFLPGANTSDATAVSADGSVVVGSAIMPGGGISAWRWSQATGMADLGNLGSAVATIPYGVNPDGSVIVGQGSSARGSEAFRWTLTSGMAALGDLDGGPFNSKGAATNLDGSLVVGYGSVAEGADAIFWTQAGGLQSFSDLPGGIRKAEAFDVTPNGVHVVGYGTGASREALRWSSGQRTQLGFLEGGSTVSSQAYAVSEDGSVIVGVSTSAQSNPDVQAFRWTAAGGMVGLGDLPGGNFRSEARDVSGDGTRVVGNSSVASGRAAFIWILGGGMVDLLAWLQNRGVTGLTGWTLTSATGISQDGKVIVGSGVNPTGKTEAWLAKLN